MSNNGLGIEKPHVCVCGYISKTTKGFRRHRTRRCPYKRVKA